MKGKRNEAFFQQNNTSNNSLQHSQHSQTNSFSSLYKLSHKTGLLNLSSKSLNLIPSEVFQLNYLLDSDENFWEIVPLTKLDLSYNEITEIPSEISNLIDLNTLKLRNNLISILNIKLFECSKLKYLDLTSNKLNSINNYFNGILSELQECLINENNLNEFPIFLINCYDIKIIELNTNKIRFIPQDILNLRQLIRLCLNNNSLEEIPISISTLNNLQVLDIRKNRLTSLPDLKQLINLTLLDAGENMIVEVNYFNF